jgi:hypothetical protein
MRYLLCVILVLGLSGCNFVNQFQEKFDNEQCIDDLNFAMNPIGFSKDRVRSALDSCEDIKKKTDAVKKRIARAEVCVGDYDAAAVIIKEYPKKLGYLNKVIADKKSKPGSYQCMTNIDDKRCIEQSGELDSHFKGGDPFNVCATAPAICRGISDDHTAVAAKEHVDQVCDKKRSCVHSPDLPNVCLPVD